jgi:hypothetical protein
LSDGSPRSAMKSGTSTKDRTYQCDSRPHNDTSLTAFDLVLLEVVQDIGGFLCSMA